MHHTDLGVLFNLSTYGFQQFRYSCATVQISTFMCLWAIYTFPRSICLFCCRKYEDRSWEFINRSQTHECGNWDWGRATPRKKYINGIMELSLHRASLIHYGDRRRIQICSPPHSRVSEYRQSSTCHSERRSSLSQLVAWRGSESQTR